MKLWLLEQVQNPDWAEYEGFVVRAETEEGARALAAAEAGDEGPSIWHDPRRSHCDPLPVRGQCGVVLSAFKNG